MNQDCFATYLVLVHKLVEFLWWQEVSNVMFPLGEGRVRLLSLGLGLGHLQSPGLVLPGAALRVLVTVVVKLTPAQTVLLNTSLHLLSCYVSIQSCHLQLIFTLFPLIFR